MLSLAIVAIKRVFQMNKFDIIIEFAHSVHDLPEDMQGRLFQAVCQYLESGVLTNLNSTEKALFNSFKWRFDNILEKERRLSETRRAAGSLGGKSKWGKEAVKKQRKQMIANAIPSRALLSPVVNINNNIQQDGDIERDSEIEIRGCGGKEEEERESENPTVFSAQKQFPSDAEDMEERYARRYHEENDWATVAMLSHLGIDQLKALFPEFMLEQKHKMVTHQDYSDFKTHFLNYARRKAEILRQKTKQQQSNGNQQTCDRRRAAEVNDGIDYSEDF